MKFRTVDQWQEIILARKTSGLGIGQFCRKNQISVTSFYKWEKIVGGQTPKAPASIVTKAAQKLPAFITVDVTSKAAEPPSGRHLVIVTSYGARLEIPL